MTIDQINRVCASMRSPTKAGRDAIEKLRRKAISGIPAARWVVREHGIKGGIFTAAESA